MAGSLNHDLLGVELGMYFMFIITNANIQMSVSSVR